MDCRSRDDDGRTHDRESEGMEAVSPPMDTTPDPLEANQRAALRRNRGLATALLLCAAVTFLATTLVHETGFWVLLVRASAEAAVVGALADWFAVTAVFRRPLGLPIPHTAIVPRNKDRIGAALGAFVANNFLTPALITAKLREIDPAGRLSSWLAQPSNAEAAAQRAMLALPTLIGALEDPEIREFAIRAVGEQLRSADLAAVLGKTLAAMTAGEPFDTLVDRLLDALHGALDTYAPAIYEGVEERTAWWIPKVIDRRIAKGIVGGLAELITELREPGNPKRIAIRRQVEQLADDLIHSPSHRARLESLKTQLLAQPEIRVWLATLWDALRNIVLADLAQPDSKTREAIMRALLSFGRTLSGDLAMRARFNANIEEAALAIIVPWRHEIGQFISDAVKGWEARTVVDRLELALGADLHYIRITGTLVGACVGCALFLVSVLLG
jgi:uncharacterized membrane-anchored protein YjiN (DUF445 family)